MKLDEAWIRAHLPKAQADARLDFFSGEYLDGLTVMAEGERGGPDTVVYRAESEEDLRFWQLEQICRFLPEKDPPAPKIWRYSRDHAENGRWFYIERRRYDYDAIEDDRLCGFERFLRNLKYGFPPERWEQKVREHVRLMNHWYAVPHWDYDRERLCFIEISGSRENDGDGVEEPRPGSILRVVDNGEKAAERMAKYSEQDLQYAAEFREEIHREALAIVRKTRPYITEVIDRHPVEDYFQEHWDYPGKWYTIVAIPYGYGSRKAFVDAIVRDTLSGRVPEKERTCTQELRDMAKTEPGRHRLTNQLDAKPDGYEERFVVEVDQKSRSFRAVGTDAEGRYILEHYEEYSLGSATGSTSAYYVLTDVEYRRYARLALINRQLKKEDYDRLTAEIKKAPKREEDPFYLLLAEYPDLAVDYCLVPGDPTRCQGCEEHRRALEQACRELFAPDGEDEGWNYDVRRAKGKRIDAETLFTSRYPKDALNYRKAFLYPPHGNGYTGADFVRVNAALFPNGTEGLEVYEWTTDWSDYFDEGHEWWGALCLTVYDPSLRRFAVILASATD